MDWLESHSPYPQYSSSTTQLLSRQLSLGQDGSVGQHVFYGEGLVVVPIYILLNYRFKFMKCSPHYFRSYKIVVLFL